MRGFSEGMVLLTNKHTSNGKFVHQAMKNELVDIYLQKVQMNNDVEFVSVDQHSYVKVCIGSYEYSITVAEHNGKILENLPVYANEEIWISITNPNRWVAFGKCTNMK